MLATRGVFWIVTFAAFGLLIAFVPAKKKSNPPGTIYFRDNLFMDAEPIDNIGYLEFLYSTSHYDRDCMLAYVNAMDNGQLLWVDDCKKYFDEHCKLSESETDSLVRFRSFPFAYCYFNDTSFLEGDVYLKHPAFYSYPFVGADYEEAKNYCEWRTAMVKILYHVSYSAQERPIKAYSNFEYRLPTYDELVTFAKQFETMGKVVKPEENSTDTLWCPRLSVSKKPKEAAFSNIYEYTRSEDSLFYVMESDTGLTFSNQVDETMIGKRYKGFRCVCEIKD
ncbi:hypothetical protein BH09BAC1_BH09BAC1_09110 [soil metagenome]